MSVLGLKTELINFAIYVITLSLAACAASSTAFFVSAGIRVFALADVLITITFVFQLVCTCSANMCSLSVSIIQIFGGFLVNFNSVVDWLSWLQYISVFRYTLNVSLV